MAPTTALPPPPPIAAPCPPPTHHHRNSTTTPVHAAAAVTTTSNGSASTGTLSASTGAPASIHHAAPAAPAAAAAALAPPLPEAPSPSTTPTMPSAATGSPLPPPRVCSSTAASTRRPSLAPPEPAFEMVVLGCGGGPLETDCSGYLVKPARSRWEDGVLALEGGSGIGALSNLIDKHSAASMFPSITFPDTHNTPVLQAAYIFSFLTCYLITHAHLDHCASLILLSGSVPPRQPRGPASHPAPQNGHVEDTAPLPTRIPVYAMLATLDNLAAAYGGGLWPELGAWATEPERGRGGRLKKRKRHDDDGGVGARFSPLGPTPAPHQLHPTLPISTQVFPVSHGDTSHGPYQSSAVFVRYDPTMLASLPPSLAPSRAVSRSTSTSKLGSPSEESFTGIPDPLTAAVDSVRHGADGREFLFFGDVESGYRAQGEEHVLAHARHTAADLNYAIWRQAAKSFAEGRLSAIFIECSYDNSRPAHVMFGHVSPPAIIHELKTLASFLPDTDYPLAGLKVHITHIKEFLVPHPTGRTARDLIESQLNELEEQSGLGVEFVILAPGDRVLI